MELEELEDVLICVLELEWLLVEEVELEELEEVLI